jgi:hypothetical protein
MTGSRACLERMVRLFLFSVAACFASGSALQPAQAQVYMTAQAIIICQTPANGVPSVTTTPGTGCAPHNSLTNPTGALGSSTNPYGWYDAPSATDINSAIAKQAGIILAWVAQPIYYNNSNFQSITDILCYTPNGTANPPLNPNCTAPFVLNSKQFTTLTTPGSLTPSPLYPDPRVVSVVFGNSLTPPASLSGKLLEIAWIGRNGVYVPAATFSTGRTVSPCFGCIMHGMFHNQGLDHQDVFNYNTQAPSLDLMTLGSTRKEATDSPTNTLASGTANVVSLLGTGNGNGQAYQLTTPTTPTTPINPGTSYQRAQVFTSGLVTSQALLISTITDPPGSNLITVTTTNGSYNGSIPPLWPANPTLIKHTVTTGPGLAFDPLNPPKFQKNGSYVQSLSLHTGNANDPDCSGASIQCWVMILSGLPSSAGPLQFTVGILLKSPPPPPGSTFLGNIVARGLYFTYKTNDGLSVTAKATSTAGGVMTNSQNFSTPAMPALIDPVVQQAFMKTVTSPPAACNTNVTSSAPSDSNGCPAYELRDGVPSEDTGQWAVPEISSCTTASSLSVLAQIPNVTAYVANGSWTDGHTGVRVVPIEPTTPLAAPTPVSTANPVNSCASNPYTSQTVCTANNNSVYLLSGTSLTGTLTSSASGNGFTNNSCRNCEVVLNHVTNEALIAMSTSNASSGLQFLNLMSNMFTPIPPVSATNPVSEGILWDAGRNLILSPNGEGPGQNGNGIYDLFDTSWTITTPELSNPVYTLPGGGAEQTSLEAAAEDCLTGIALATKESSSALYLGDLSQRTTPTSTSWTAPQQFLFFPEFQFNQGNAGIAVAPGSHLAVVTGESGGDQFGVVELPSTNVADTAPNVVDYVAAYLPKTPDNNVWSAGSDPHTLTAYVSPNNGTAYAVMANSPPPKFLAVIDMAALLKAPRAGETNNVLQCDRYDSGGCVDLIGAGIVRYVATGN